MNLEVDMNIGLIYGAYHRKNFLVKSLIDCGADIHYRNDDCLIYAAEHRDYDLTELCLKNGANVHALGLEKGKR